MEVKLKITWIHMATAIVAAILSTVFSVGLIGLKNQLLAGVVGLAVLYVTGQVCEKLFGKEELGGFRSWFSEGILPFFCIWFLIWILLYNYLGFPNLPNP
ncbi:MAG: DUF5379 domain-containing protein [Methanobrevibacter sp.]|jgi:hypothetical protein|nr:DUF5379 domain-containing protein [Methanobrevibacter sp.]